MSVNVRSFIHTDSSNATVVVSGIITFVEVDTSAIFDDITIVTLAISVESCDSNIELIDTDSIVTTGEIIKIAFLNVTTCKFINSFVSGKTVTYMC